ncbi:MAG: family 43 glycosylhydrolase [Lachnospiraceae bacterium]|nr:family 43 glycosylhydrolase [Lachnospiraceae bacterium]
MKNTVKIFLLILILTFCTGCATASDTVGEVSNAEGEDESFDNPLIAQRADPYVIYNEDDGYYYFTSSWPAYRDAEHGYDRIAIRRSASLKGLAEAEDKIIWKAHSSGAQSHHIWAPEIHKIGEKWYIYYAANSDNDIWSIRPWVLECTDPSKLTDPEAWVERGRFVNKAGNYNGAFNAFSLDMTTFENKGKQYVIWAYKTDASRLLMAATDPSEPWKLISDPIILSSPEYDWEKVNEIVNEGPAVLKHEGKIYVTYSASATGPEYCIGMLSADEDSDLMDAASWSKSETPVLQSSDFTDQYGPGHNCFTVDETGNTVIVYHSRDQKCFDNECEWADADPLYDPCRNANLAYVHYADDGTPVLKDTGSK